MHANTQLMANSLQQLANAHGFVVFVLEPYYIQFSKDEGEHPLYMEAVSHHYLPGLSPALRKHFAALGFKIEGGNYYKWVDASKLKELLPEMEQIFISIYEADYHKPIGVTIEI